MEKMILPKKVFILLICLVVLTVVIGCASEPEPEIHSIILMIGDGMGVDYLKGARAVGGENLWMDLVAQDGYYFEVETDSLSERLTTDSAAAATALATGVRTLNRYLGLDPEQNELTNITEIASSAGKWTGIVTNTRITHATPAGFYARSPDRRLEHFIADQLIHGHPVNLAFGGSNEEDFPGYGSYTVLRSRSSMHDYNMQTGSDPYILGLFTADGHMSYEQERPACEPPIWEMTRKALDILGGNDDGFFLMVEGGQIDFAGHANNIENAMVETLAFDLAVRKAWDYARDNPGTLLVIVADHETGGLEVAVKEEGNLGLEELKSNPQAIEEIIDYSWKHTKHTSWPVPLIIWGVTDLEYFDELESIHLEDVGRFMIEQFTKGK